MPKRAAYWKGRVLRPHKFKAWRDFFELSGEKLAEMMGTTKSRISEKENFNEPYDQYFLEALADALHVPEPDLIAVDPYSVDDLDEITRIWKRSSLLQRKLFMDLAVRIASDGGIADTSLIIKEKIINETAIAALGSGVDGNDDIPNASSGLRRNRSKSPTPMPRRRQSKGKKPTIGPRRPDRPRQPRERL